MAEGARNAPSRVAPQDERINLSQQHSLCCGAGFFMTGLSPVPEKETIAILSVIDKARIARNDPDVWYPL